VNHVTIIHVETDQLGGQFGKPVEASFSRSKLKSNVLPLDVPQIAQPLPKLPPKLFWIDIANDQCADGRGLRLLRVGRERPHSRRAAEQRDELAPLDAEHGGSSPVTRVAIATPWQGPIDARFTARSVCRKEAEKLPWARPESLNRGEAMPPRVPLFSTP
jgi:hypothetical protein